MRESHKSKRVTWASDVNLCQVRLFLSEDPPAQVGLDSQDHLQAKTSWLSHQTGTAGPDDVLPPGFEAAHPPNQSQIILSQIPTIKWKCPPRFVLEFTWQVVAGEESEETGIQNQRELRVLEAVYPRPSAIPPNPSVTPNTEDTAYDDGRTPSIPITPIEDEDAAADTLSEATAQYDSSRNSQSLQHPSGSQHSTLHRVNPPGPEKPAAAGMALGTEPGILAAALTGLMNSNSNEQGNLIDHELLLKILGNPKMVEKLVTDYGTPTNNATTQNGTPVTRSPAVSMSDQPRTHINRTQPPSTIPMSASASSGPHYPPQNGTSMGHLPNSRHPPPPPMPAPSPSPHVGAPTKDLSYYKSLIQQHGGDRPEAVPPQYGNRYNHQPGTNQEPANGHKPRDLKPKIMKPCIYFNSSRGCRHGANCAYQHDASFQQRGGSMPEVQTAKRAKFDREISS